METQPSREGEVMEKQLIQPVHIFCDLGSVRLLLNSKYFMLAYSISD